MKGRLRWVGLLSLLVTSCASPSDPGECDALTRPGPEAEGDVLVEYADHLVGRAPASFPAKKVSPDDDSLSLNACGASESGRVWQLQWTWHTIPPAGDLPAEAFLDDDQGGIVTGGLLTRCDDDQCYLGGADRIHTTQYEPAEGGGTVEAYDREARLFRANLEVTETEFTMTLRVDLSWQ